MTASDIKNSTSMADVLGMYGVRADRNGFCNCPLPGHVKDKTASFRVYGDNFYCYGCNATGDIFDFVRLMDGCSFADAYRKLGGRYGKPTAKDIFSRYRVKHETERRKRRSDQEHEEWLRQVNDFKHEEWLLRRSIDSGKLKPLSDGWALIMNRLVTVSGLLDLLCGVGITYWGDKEEQKDGR